jgi:hypothetical protein
MPNFPICGNPAIKISLIMTSPQLNQVNTAPQNNEINPPPRSFEVFQTSLANSPICGTSIIEMFTGLTSP